MDLNQRKLNKSEWNSIEIPVSETEQNILQLIIKGNKDVNIKINHNSSLFSFLKIEYSEKMEDYLYIKYLYEKCNKIQEQIKTIHKDYVTIKVDPNVKINSADKIRLERNDESKLQNKELYEYVLLGHADKFLYYKIKLLSKEKEKEKMDSKKKEKMKQSLYHYYTLFKLLKNNISYVNRHVLYICNKIISLFEDDIDISLIIEYADEFIEKNKSLLQYSDLSLYEHQKEIITISKNPDPKLVLYMAPTGTGKTLTPIALSETHKIIFLCAARHVGLALARAAISIGKKIAFAFGCESADDIRLHYFAAKEYSKNKRTGGIGKVDNSIGDNVEIMICDIKSYLPAMYYMLAFNKDDNDETRLDNLIVYWDEPTITLDYQNHEFHPIIKKNWTENLIPNVVLSSATLPKLHELTETIADFQNRFPNSSTYNIVSHDCKKTIPIINTEGYVVLPHYLSENYDDVVKIAKHCENYLTLMRYFDLKEIVEFVTFVNKNNYSNTKMKLMRHFESLEDVNMQSIKLYYIKMLQNIIQGTWGAIYTNFKVLRRQKIENNATVDISGNKIIKSQSIGPGVNINSNKPLPGSLLAESKLAGSKLAGSSLTRLSSEQNTSTSMNSTTKGTSGVYVTTKDAYTLTDGPTIFITNEVEKIAKFCIQQANIPSVVMDDILKKIEFNNVLNEKIQAIETEIDYIKEQSEEKVKNSSSGRIKSSTKDVKKLNKFSPDDLEDHNSKMNKFSKLDNELKSLRSLIKSARLNDTFVPNKHNHIKKWAEAMNPVNAFTCDIEDNIVNEIMLLNGISDSWKVLLMMGIGVFINHPNIQYTEIMKKMADEQKLYMIIASSDYIYGTNYQFCHGYLSKDLNLTQEKIIQAMGRIGRNNIQQNFTIRFRDDMQIMKLFTNETDKPEIMNMNILFNSNNVLWNGSVYETVPAM